MFYPLHSESVWGGHFHHALTPAEAYKQWNFTNTFIFLTLPDFRYYIVSADGTIINGIIQLNVAELTNSNVYFVKCKNISINPDSHYTNFFNALYELGAAYKKIAAILQFSNNVYEFSLYTNYAIQAEPMTYLLPIGNQMLGKNIDVCEFQITGQQSTYSLCSIDIIKIESSYFIELRLERPFFFNESENPAFITFELGHKKYRACDCAQPQQSCVRCKYRFLSRFNIQSFTYFDEEAPLRTTTDKDGHTLLDPYGTHPYKVGYSFIVELDLPSTAKKYDVKFHSFLQQFLRPYQFTDSARGALTHHYSNFVKGKWI